MIRLAEGDFSFPQITVIRNPGVSLAHLDPAQRPGPKGPSKLTENVLSFVKERLQTDTSISTPELLAQVQEKFGVSFHRRTLEKLLKDLRSKKNG